MEPTLAPILANAPAKLPFHARPNDARPEPQLLRRGDLAPGGFIPLQDQFVALQTPGDGEASVAFCQRAILGRVGGELVHGERQVLRDRRHDVDPRTADGDAIGSAVRRKFFVHQAQQVGAAPARFGEQIVRRRHGADAALDRRREVRGAVRRHQRNDRLDHRQRVARAVVDFARQQFLPRNRRFEIRRALSDPMLECIVHTRQFPRLAVQIDEDSHLGAQYARHHRHT